MLTLEQVIPYLSTDSGIDTNQTTYTQALLEGCCDYAEQYTNRTIDGDSPQGLIQGVADLMTYHHSQRPHLNELKTEDMTLAFNTSVPAHIIKRLIQYRRVKW